MANKGIIPNSSVQSQRYIYVDQDSPLANLTSDHPMYNYVVVTEDSNPDENDQYVPDLSDSDSEENFEYSDILVDDVIEDLNVSMLTSPINLSIPNDSFTMKPTLDGTMRVSAYLYFDQVVGADEYEFKIMSVEV